MNNNQISPFEYVSILISIILGLGITQILSSFSDLLYHYKKVKFYWVHTIWIVFVLFLHIQEWFITYQLKGKMIWNLPELLFILLYPIILYVVAKMLIPSNEDQERFDMKSYYLSHFHIIFTLIAFTIILSISFNMLYLNMVTLQQIPLILFLFTIVFLSLKRIQNEIIHKILSIVLLASVVFSIIIERNFWIIK
jgi:hypothetical protein